MTATAFAAAFAQNATVQELAVLAAVQRPIAPACITVAVDRPLWKDRPTWFLVAEQDRIRLHPSLKGFEPLVSAGTEERHRSGSVG